MDLKIVPVSEKSRSTMLRLQVAEGQENYIETVEECLGEAEGDSCWRPVGLYDGDLLVGFSMYCRWEDKPEGRVWLDRLLIDKRFQGRGYGRFFVKALILRLEQEYGCSEIYLSVYPENSGAIRLYESFGFRFNGELDTHGEHVMVRRMQD
ncbi:GNAT family N-acetyltransferase [Cuneatibacter caecimuris]|uniref:Diamine N-acetyltransferase n=1 Tax=Cuneatibacter caecimuris TaxID=1796618 RepID=A0A4Q7PP77_9FIRM|nr:GNAT family N-acetyltransferase [Cuneatibacter caecimuris]RZT02653.1 diamine N-acetyltransferase [Cuneatibacter caecimuris]